MKTYNNSLLPVINSNFTGGDIRDSEHPALSVIHTLWLREHTRIAGIVQKNKRISSQK
jgi:hypothetical protein